jgi:hypothetical protein
MPDFTRMNESQLKAFRLKKNRELRAIRDEIRAAGQSLERLRAEADRAEYDASVAMYGAEAVAAASKIVVAPPASAAPDSPLRKGTV